MQRRMLIVEDNELSRQHLQKLLETEPITVDVVGDGTQALQALGKHNYSIVLTDLKMPHVDGMELIKTVQERQLPVTVIVMTGYGSIDEAVRAMRLGAYDFLTKPLDVEHLRQAVRRALHERSLQDELLQLREILHERYDCQNILTKNPRMLAILELVQQVAAATSSVLIEGETGTGKELIARAIHQSSPLRAGPLVAVNCAALPETLLESELFGHEKGAFTGAVGQRAGRFELAHGGTLFLDEVGDVPASMQAKLLRVLQERRFERVGGTQTIEVDVRVIAATHRSLTQLVAEGKFREDLYYRLNVVKIDLPPLRERPEDIPLLATYFAQKYAKSGQTPKTIAPEALERLSQHSWPGNIRELENAIEQACVTSDEVIRVENLPPEVVSPAGAKFPFAVDLSRPLTEVLDEITTKVERRYLRKALKRSRGNIGRCAELCGMSRRNLSYKLAKYKLNRSEFND
jgi:two-component system response regulator AtoC